MTYKIALLAVGLICFAIGYAVADYSMISAEEDVSRMVKDIDAKIEMFERIIAHLEEKCAKFSYERDLAVSQLDDLGYRLGEPIMDKDIYKDPCESCAFSDAPEDYHVCEQCGEKTE